MYIDSAFDTSLGIDGAWVHSNPTGCIVMSTTPNSRSWSDIRTVPRI